MGLDLFFRAEEKQNAASISHGHTGGFSLLAQKITH